METGAQSRELIISSEHVGIRLDQFLAKSLAVSRGEAQRLLESGRARLDGANAKPNHKLRAGERVTAERAEPRPTLLIPEVIPLDIIFEDTNLLVINKPRGMVVHPAPGAQEGTLVHAVLGYVDDLSGIGGEVRPGIVHRLDKDTSGLMVVAKTDAAHVSLQSQIQARTAERRYQAIVWGQPKFEHAVVDAPIGRHPSDRKKMAVVTDPRHTARDAVTELTVHERLGEFCLIEARLQTGRTHQIRVHCQYAGHPVVGDLTYGGIRKMPTQSASQRHRESIYAAIEALNGQALHAFSLSFDHPCTRERLAFTAPMPHVMTDLLDAIHAAIKKSE